MAILLEFNYGKKLGLPGYSSHNFGVSVKSEVTDPTAIPGEAKRLYSVLQDSVDAQIKIPGYVPGEPTRQIKESDTEESTHKPPETGHDTTDPGMWQCSDKQCDLILNILGRNNLRLSIVDTIAEHLHGRPMTELNRMESSGVVSEILERYGRRKPNGKAAQQ
jgi:hypothetical protein